MLLQVYATISYVTTSVCHYQLCYYKCMPLSAMLLQVYATISYVTTSVCMPLSAMLLQCMPLSAMLLQVYATISYVTTVYATISYVTTSVCHYQLCYYKCMPLSEFVKNSLYVHVQPITFLRIIVMKAWHWISLRSWFKMNRNYLLILKENIRKYKNCSDKSTKVKYSCTG